MEFETSLGSRPFPQTRWTLVADSSDRGSLEDLCRIYWGPIYGFLRRTGHPREDAEDLTQSFFVRILKNESLGAADQEKGRFRTFLLAALKRHVTDHRRFETRQKRGSGAEHLPLAISEVDLDDAEHRYASHPVDTLTPDKIFDQTWALALLNRTHMRIQADYRKAGKIKEYDELREALAATGEIDSKNAAKKLRVAPGTVRVLVHRLRQNFRAALRDEIAETVRSRREIDDELGHLMEVFG